MTQTIMNSTGTTDGYQVFGDMIYSIGDKLDEISTTRQDLQQTVASISGVYADRFWISGIGS